jgi:hypothetical protein
LNHLLRLSVREKILSSSVAVKASSPIFIVRLIWHCEDGYRLIWNSSLVCDTLN